MKSTKRIIRVNISDRGSLNIDKTSEAILQYLKTPLRGVDKSPAQLAVGRQLRDGVPTATHNLQVDKHWRQTLRKRELEIAKTHEILAGKDTSRRLAPLQPGNQVRIQNPVSNKWDRTGVVTEALQHRQYTVRLDGSGRVSLRNRRHLRCSGPPALNTPTNSPPTAQRTQERCQPTMELRTKRKTSKPVWMADYTP